MEYLKIGDPVLWRGGWGKDAPRRVFVEFLEVECVDKEGTPANCVKWSAVKDDTVIVTLNNGHWAYGYQIAPLE